MQGIRSGAKADCCLSVPKRNGIVLSLRPADRTPYRHWVYKDHIRMTVLHGGFSAREDNSAGIEARRLV